MSDISQKILLFHDQLETDIYHRYKSWEHCYSYFTGPAIDEDHACLHLAFYLASWGMYRGSSFLLWKDYLIHKEVVKKIISMKRLREINFSKQNDQTATEIIEFVGWIKLSYQNHITDINGQATKINVTDTLATKILLGTLGCIPAYDRYFIGGLRTERISYSSLSERNFMAVIRFYQNNISAFDFAQASIQKSSGILYPAMKLVDMYFWQIGYENDK